MADPMIYILDSLAFIGFYSILSIALNLQYGFTNLSNFGVASLFMIGAYSSALMARAGLPYPVCLILSMIPSGLIGFLISLPALRLTGDYLAIAMTAVSEVVRVIFKNEDWIGGGVLGLVVPLAFSIPDASPRLNMALQLALIYSVLATCYIIAELITNSPYGRVLRAIREDELSVQVLGKNTLKCKAQIFTLGSVMAGLSGSLFSQYMGFIDPYMFEPTLTFTVWIMVILGGPANNAGSLVGAMLVTVFERGARIAKDYLLLPLDPTNVRVVLIGILIILVIRYRSKGILIERKIKTPALKIVPMRTSRAHTETESGVEHG